MSATAQKLISPTHDTRQQGRVALSAFFSIMEQWECSIDEQRVLLGGISRSTFYKYKSLPELALPKDTLERISYVMGIYHALRTLFPNSNQANQWIKKTNNAAMFSGRSALQKMLAGNVVDLADVRRFLDFWRG